MKNLYFNNITINSVQIVVPYKKCINRCKFCISCMNPVAKYNIFTNSEEMQIAYVEKLKYLYDFGCENIVITGDNEPLMDKDFLLFLAVVLNQTKVNFSNIEIQTSGVFLNESMLNFLKYKIHIDLICLSVASLNAKANADIMGVHNELIYDFKSISYHIHQSNIKLRITIILTDWYNRYENNIEKLFKDIYSIFMPNQITFKILKKINISSNEHYWIESHSVSINTINNLLNFLSVNARVVSVYAGMNIYEYMGISIMFDYDCMKNKLEKGYRYVILFPNGELHESWF